MLLEEGFQVTSVDASDKMLKYALKERWERRKEESFDRWGAGGGCGWKGGGGPMRTPTPQPLYWGIWPEPLPWLPWSFVYCPLSLAGAWAPRVGAVSARWPCCRNGQGPAGAGCSASPGHGPRLPAGPRPDPAPTGSRDRLGDAGLGRGLVMRGGERLLGRWGGVPALIWSPVLQLSRRPTG